jgi:hypothetical protein
MVAIQLKALNHQDFVRGENPPDPENCCLTFAANIGSADSDGSDLFYFQVVTGAWLVDHAETRWGKGYLLVDRFSWDSVERMIARLVGSITSDTWHDAASQLSKYLDWEFENYRA